VLLWCSAADGEDSPPAELAKHKARESAWLRRLSTHSRFQLFARDFLGGRRPFPVREGQQAGRPVVQLSLRQAAEFLSKKDYVDNWSSEMNEEFCFWSFADWKQVLAEAGFRIHENPNDPAASSRVYVNGRGGNIDLWCGAFESFPNDLGRVEGNPQKHIRDPCHLPLLVLRRTPLAMVAEVPMQIISWPPKAFRQRRISGATSAPWRPR